MRLHASQTQVGLAGLLYHVPGRHSWREARGGEAEEEEAGGDEGEKKCHGCNERGCGRSESAYLLRGRSRRRRAVALKCCKADELIERLCRCRSQRSTCYEDAAPNAADDDATTVGVR